MNIWIIIGIIARLLIFAIIATVKAISNSKTKHLKCPLSYNSL